MKIKQITSQDFHVLKAFYQDEDVMKYITGYVIDEDEMNERWEKIMSWDSHKGYGYFQFIENDSLIGVGCLKPFGKDVELGYMLNKAYWGQGYGSTICQLLLDKIDTMDVTKVVAYIDPLNEASSRILRKHGFTSMYKVDDEEFFEKKLRNRITGYTGLYGIVAYPIKHSFSPMMHNTAFELLGIDDVYLAFEVLDNQFEKYIESVKTLGIKGFNVSMPYKEKIINYLDEMTQEAQLCQSVNTVKNENGKLIGHISDGIGFVKACQSQGWDVQNQKVVILGAGGAAKAIIVALAGAHVSEIVVYNRSDKPFIKELAKQLSCSLTLKSLHCLDELKEDLKEAYLLIQTTNVGMTPYEEGCLIPDSSYLSHQLKVADIIYHPKETKLLKMAKEKNLDYMNGEGMILYQGAVSFEFWTGKDMPIAGVKKALKMEGK